MARKPTRQARLFFGGASIAGAARFMSTGARVLLGGTTESSSFGAMGEIRPVSSRAEALSYVR